MGANTLEPKNILDEYMDPKGQARGPENLITLNPKPDLIAEVPLEKRSLSARLLWVLRDSKPLEASCCP